MNDQIYYRYEGSCNVSLLELKAIRATNAGVWIDYFGKPRFNLNCATKRFAFENKEDAFKSFLARKRKQLAIHKAGVREVEELVEAMKDSKEVDYLNKYKYWTNNKISFDTAPIVIESR